VVGDHRCRFYRTNILTAITNKTNAQIAQEAHLVLVAEDITPTPP